MDELIKALDENGYSSNPSMTLTDVIAYTMQDAQYSSGASANYRILSKYQEQYGNLTVEVLRTLTR